MCVYYYVDSDKSKSENAIARILEIIDNAFDNPDPFIAKMAEQLKRELSVRGLYDSSSAERLKALLADFQYFKSETLKSLEKDPSLFKIESKVRIGDITPVMTDMNDIKMMKFGIIGFNNTTLFNTRSEDAESKPTWKGLMSRNRCVIPANQYIETHTDLVTKKKTPYLFWTPEKNRFYMAGLWRQEESIFKKFTVLTRQAVGEIEKIHDRMPVSTLR